MIMATAEIPTKRRHPLQTEKTPPPKRRIVVEKGRAHTSADIDLPDWNHIDFIAPEFEDKVKYWYPGAKKKSAQAGEPFIFRLLPALSTQIEGVETTGDKFSDWKPGRETDGTLNNAMFRQVGVIEQFGSNRQVSFIPCLPYDMPKAPPFSSLKDNPYQCLCDALFQMKGSGIDPNWQPLVMTKKEIDAYRDKHGLHNKVYSSNLLPMRNSRFFAYAWIYRGYNTVLQKDFFYKDVPYGSKPEHGLQIISISHSAVNALQAEYRRSIRGEGKKNRFQYPDPAQFDAGTLNYVWLAKTTNPIDGGPGSDNIMGYTAAVAEDYYGVPDSPVEVDLTVPKNFQEWYYDNWQAWSDVLKGTWGREQVFLIARYFPELKGVCKRVWGGHKSLMTAWEEAFASVDFDESYDFHEILHRKYGLQSERSTDVDDSDQPDSRDYTTSTRRPVAGSKVTRQPAKRRPASDLESEDFQYDSDRDDGEEPEKPVRSQRKFTREQEPERKPKQRPEESRPAPRRRPPVEQEPGNENDVDTEDDDDDVPFDEPEQRKPVKRSQADTGSQQSKNVLKTLGKHVQYESAPSRKPAPMTVNEYEEPYEEEQPDYDESDFEDAGSEEDMEADDWDTENEDSEFDEEEEDYGAEMDE